MACHLDKRVLLFSLLIKRWGAVCLLGLIFLFNPPVSLAEGTFKDLYFLNLRNTLIGIHVRDTQLAFQVIMNKIIRTRYPDYRIIVDFPEDIATAKRAIENQRGHVLIINSLDFVDKRHQLTLEPLHILSKADQPTESYLLLAAAGENFETLAKQRHRSLMVENGGSGEIARIWLSTWLWRRGYEQVETFFSVIRVADKPSRAILPIFFGETDTCVVTESAFSVMTELNPQIKQKLTILARSPGFANLILCTTKQIDPLDKQRVFDEAMAMNESADGQQVLTIVQMKRIFRFEPHDFAATEALYRDYQELRKKDG